MLKTLWNVFVALVLIHVLLLGGAVAWLWSTGRLNGERAGRIKEMLSQTIVQEQAQLAQAKALEEQAKRKSEDVARMIALGKGPISARDRLAMEDRDLEVFLQRQERMEREKDDLMRQIQVAKDTLQKQKAEFDAERQAFAKALAEERKQRDDRDFQLAVQMYEQLKPRQTKEMFQDLLRKNMTEQVVGYLAAMQLRKAAAVLKEFKSAEEIPQAADLVQRLRTRGVDVLGQSGSAAPDAAADKTPPSGGSS